jgi:hypothetical protein
MSLDLIPVNSFFGWIIETLELPGRVHGTSRTPAMEVLDTFFTSEKSGALLARLKV